jgi:hypothetical protein
MKKNLSTRMYDVSFLADCMVFRAIITQNAFRHEPDKPQPKQLNVELLGQPPTISVGY